MFSELSAKELRTLTYLMERAREDSAVHYGVFSEVATEAVIVLDSAAVEYDIRAQRLERLTANAT